MMRNIIKIACGYNQREIKANALGRTSDGCLLQDENKIHLPNLVADYHKKILVLDLMSFIDHFAKLGVPGF